MEKHGVSSILTVLEGTCMRHPRQPLRPPCRWAKVRPSGRSACWRPSRPRATRPGAGSPLHVHHREDEWFYVIEGSVTFWVGGQVFEAGPGAFVYGPRETPHT